MKIFFTGSFFGQKQYGKHYDRIVRILEELGAEVIRTGSEEYKSIYTEDDLRKFSKEELHYRFIREGIARADAVVVEASQEDFRIGHEATLAIIYKKPVLCLSVNEDYGKLVRHEAFRGEKYTLRDLKKILTDFLHEVSKTVRSTRKAKFQKSRPSSGERRGKSILVFGSINADLFTSVDKIPRENEVVVAKGLKVTPGGKATNAAIGLSRLGEQAIMFGKVGNDDFGYNIKQVFEQEWVETDYILTDPFMPTGSVIVMTNERGENTLTVNEDANTRLTKEEVDGLLRKLKRKKVAIDAFFSTFEPPMEVVAYAVEKFHTLRVPVFVDAAPTKTKFPKSILANADFISPNQQEATAMTGVTVIGPQSAEKAALRLQRMGANTVVITLAEQGALLLEKGSRAGEHFPALQVKQIDTTASGDAFRAAFIVRYLHTGDLRESIRFANRAGGYAVTRLGAYESMPTWEELEVFSPS